MNKSTFYGKIHSIIYYAESKSINIVLSTEEIRKNSKGEKVVDYINVPLIAWDTAAETLFNYSSRGDYLLIKDASFRVSNYDNSFFFRINDFKIIKVAKE